TGTVRIKLSSLGLSDSGSLVSASDVVMKPGGYLYCDNYGANVNRLNDTGTVTMRGGDLGLYGYNSGAMTETIGTLHLESGLGGIFVYNDGYDTTLSVGALTRDKGATFYVDDNSDLGGKDKIIFGSGATPDDGILPFTNIYDSAQGVYLFATHDGTNGITKSSGYVTSLGAEANASSNVMLSGGSPAVTETKAINSLILNDASLSGSAGTALTVASGGVIVSGSDTGGVVTISVPTIQFGSAEGIIQTWNSDPVVITSKISGSGGVTFDDWSWGGIVLNNNTSDYTGGTYICYGTLRYGTDNALPVNNDVTVTGGATLALDGHNATVSSLSLLDGWVSLGGGTLTAGAYTLSSGTLDFPLSGTGLLTKATDETLTIDGYVSAFTGDVDVTAGKLVVHTSMSSSDCTVRSGATLAGNGAYFKTLTLDPGSIYEPGDSPGMQTVENEVWSGGAKLTWEINDANGIAGPDGGLGETGWDWLNITGDLTILATDSDSNRFDIDITSLDTNNQLGEIAGFDNTDDYKWTIATFGGDIIGFNSKAFNLIDNFSNNNDMPASKFFIGVEGNDLKIAYSHDGIDPWDSGAGEVPEPSTLLLLLPLAAFGVWRMKRK
ncbi:MAG TPA: PEP-CTERM sorting domain-containing protein, partial [bacterium]|nr:PEP-CTERM sorting domain-containing protein [bacterium]